MGKGRLAPYLGGNYADAFAGMLAMLAAPARPNTSDVMAVAKTLERFERAVKNEQSRNLSFRNLTKAAVSTLTDAGVENADIRLSECVFEKFSLATWAQIHMPVYLYFTTYKKRRLMNLPFFLAEIIIKNGQFRADAPFHFEVHHPNSVASDVRYINKFETSLSRYSGMDRIEKIQSKELSALLNNYIDYESVIFHMIQAHYELLCNFFVTQGSFVAMTAERDSFNRGNSEIIYRNVKNCSDDSQKNEMQVELFPGFPVSCYNKPMILFVHI
jgi:hypothetical protein